ncbi:MAG: hypothetical protein FJY54_18070 [Betaproteobacteria bacterium]|nr:hypothetical protein [Betaproteobacteria bacterium]
MNTTFARWQIATLLLGLSIGAASPEAGAQTKPAAGAAFPAKPVRIIVPHAPGGGLDFIARLVSQPLNERWGVPVIVDNRPGASGMVGTNSVVQARKDGHTILFAQNSALTFRAVLDPQSVAYDALRDLVPLGMTSRSPSVLVVRSEAPQSSRPSARADDYLVWIPAYAGKTLVPPCATHCAAAR